MQKIWFPQQKFSAITPLHTRRQQQYLMPCWLDVDAKNPIIDDGWYFQPSAKVWFNARQKNAGISGIVFTEDINTFFDGCDAFLTKLMHSENFSLFWWITDRVLCWFFFILTMCQDACCIAVCHVQIGHAKYGESCKKYKLQQKIPRMVYVLYFICCFIFFMEHEDLGILMDTDWECTF